VEEYDAGEGVMLWVSQCEWDSHNEVRANFKEYGEKKDRNTKVVISWAEQVVQIIQIAFD